jgi:hypothetical protein
MALAKSQIFAGLHTSQISPGAVGTGLTAAGSTQGTALVLNDTQEVAIFGTVAASTGCVLPQSGIGDDVYVVNGGANPLNIYPPVGHILNGQAVNTAYALAVAKAARCVRVSDTRWVVIAA